MANILHEADSFTVDLRSIYSGAANNEQAQNSSSSSNSGDNQLVAILKRNDITNPETIKKLLTFGEPFTRAIKILGENVDKDGNQVRRNPILAFVAQEEVQASLINTNYLNANTFKAIYNAVAHKLVVDSEFFNSNGYNLIYCPILYKRSAKEIEEYLKLQSEVLKPTATKYDGRLQSLNKKVFIETTDSNNVTMQNASRLNSLERAKQIRSYNSDGESDKIHRNSNELDKIVAKLDTLANKFAAILSLSTSSKSGKAKKALNSPAFSGLNQKQIANAFISLSSNDILPKGQLAEDDADALVVKILSSLESHDKSESASA